MLIAERILTIRGTDPDGASVRIFLPALTGTDWTCDYEIGWPEGTRRSSALGIDAVQALTLALQKVGVDLYMSRHHQSGCLMWSDDDDGYGFPVPKNARDLLVGMDRRFDG